MLTGIPMVLFTLYMITDPQTSPSKFRSQIFFGAGIAFAYSLLLMAHVQYTCFTVLRPFVWCAAFGCGGWICAKRHA